MGQAGFSFQLPSGFWKSSFRFDVRLDTSEDFWPARPCEFLFICVPEGFSGVTLATTAHLLTPLGFHGVPFQPINVCTEPSVKKTKRTAAMKTAQQSKKKSESVQ